ncbi:InlB B-repeat-containing protein, partial [Methanimicrococcus blatticola]
MKNNFKKIAGFLFVGLLLISLAGIASAANDPDYNITVDSKEIEYSKLYYPNWDWNLNLTSSDNENTYNPTDPNPNVVKAPMIAGVDVYNTTAFNLFIPNDYVWAIANLEDTPDSTREWTIDNVTRKTYSVSYNTGDGVFDLTVVNGLENYNPDLSSDQKVLTVFGIENGRTIPKPIPDPHTTVGDNRTFAGWYTKDGTGNDWGEKWIFETGTISGSINLYAKWDAYYLVYNQNTVGGKTTPEMRIAGSTGNLQDIKSDFFSDWANKGILLRWYTNADGTGQNYANGTSFTMPVAEDSSYTKIDGKYYYTLYGIWQYNVTYYRNSTPTDATHEWRAYTPGTSVTVATIESTQWTNDGFIFDGWELVTPDLLPGYPGSTFTMPETDVRFNAKWIPEGPFTVTYNKGEGLGTAPEDNTPYMYNNDVIILGNVNNAMYKDGFKLIGWKDQNNIDRAVGSSFQITENMVLTAQWADATEYALTYDKNDGSGLTQTEQKFETNEVTLKTAAEFGWT